MLTAVTRVSGPLRGLGNVANDAEDNSRLVVWGKDVNSHLDVDWPEILERDTAAMVEAIVKAATLDGKPLAELFDNPTVARMLLRALGEDDIDELLKQQNVNANEAEESFGKVLRDVRQLVEASKHGGAAWRNGGRREVGGLVSMPAGTPLEGSPSSWSLIKAMRGLMTTVRPVRIRAGAW